MGYKSEMHLKQKLRKTPFAHNVLHRYSIMLKFWTENGSDTAMLCAKFQNDWTIEADFMDEQEFAKFELKTSLGQISYIAPWFGTCTCMCTPLIFFHVHFFYAVVCSSVCRGAFQKRLWALKSKSS